MQPVEYNLRPPFHVSTRQMPALRVADATIHMRADTLGGDPADPLMRWQYIIDGPGFEHEANDIYTQYSPKINVSDLLPTAMGTLLAYLTHITELRDTDQALPDALADWAQRHQFDIAIVAAAVDAQVAETLLRYTESRLTAERLWHDITHDLTQTPHQRWWVAQATAQADRMATLAPDPATPGLVRRGEQWHNDALAQHRTLSAQPPPDEEPDRTCLVAEPDRIREWLTQPAPYPYAGTVGDYLNLHHVDRRWDGPLALPDLIEHAQNAGLFGIPQHTVRLHNILDPVAGLDSALLTVHTPTGTTLAAGPFNLTHLLDPDRERPDAAAILQTCAQHIDAAFQTHPTTADSASRGRPFPPPTVQPTVAYQAPPPPDEPTATTTRHR